MAEQLELEKSLREEVKRIESVRITAQQVRAYERQQRLANLLLKVERHFEQSPHLPFHMTRAERDHLDQVDMRMLTAALEADGHFKMHDTIIFPTHVDK